MTDPSDMWLPGQEFVYYECDFPIVCVLFARSTQHLHCDIGITFTRDSEGIKPTGRVLETVKVSPKYWQECREKPELSNFELCVPGSMVVIWDKDTLEGRIEVVAIVDRPRLMFITAKGEVISPTTCDCVLTGYTLPRDQIRFSTEYLNALHQFWG